MKDASERQQGLAFHLRIGETKLSALLGFAGAPELESDDHVVKDGGLDDRRWAVSWVWWTYELCCREEWHRGCAAQGAPRLEL